MQNCDSEPDLISEKEMLALIEAAAERAGNPTRLAQRLGIPQSPIYRALYGDSPVSSGISMPFGYVPERMFRRIGNGQKV